MAHEAILEKMGQAPIVGTLKMSLTKTTSLGYFCCLRAGDVLASESLQEQKTFSYLYFLYPPIHYF